jgi:hypothetical protein
VDSRTRLNVTLSQLGTADGETSAIRTAGLIKSETAVRINYRYTCKHFHTFVLKEMTSSKQRSQTKIMFSYPNTKTKTQSENFYFL